MGSSHPIRKTVVPEPVVVPDKLYFRIGDVARLCDVPAYVLRFWETEFPQLKPNKGGTGQRLYRRKDVETALRIKSLLYDQGYTIPGARQVFKAETVSADVAALPVEGGASAGSPLNAGFDGGIDVGAQIREDAQKRDRLAVLQNELRALVAILGGPAGIADAAEMAAESPLAHKHKPQRPRLVLEARPEPRVPLNQGDLFAAE
jgi:DNA-binding transcriptional MerR regulator